MKENKPNPYINGYMVSSEEYLAQKQRRFQNEEPTARNQKEERSGRSPLRVSLFVLCAAVFFVSGFFLVRYFSDINRSRISSGNLREIYAATQTEDVPSAEPASTLEPPAEPITTKAPVLSAAPTVQRFADFWPAQYQDNPEMIIDEGFQQLRQKNRDIVGWLRIEGVLDEPVLQRDNSFYLTHDASGEKNVTGALFLDEGCNLRTMPHNLIIHGHNMKEGAMFGVLKKYKLKDASFYKSHPFIEFNTLYEKCTYVIFAVTEINLEPSNHFYLPFWVYKRFESEHSFDNYVTRLKEYSHFQTSVDVQPGDRLLTLATCTGNSDSERLLVVARRVRDGEDTIELRKGIFSTTVK